MTFQKKQWNYLYNLYNAFISHREPVQITHFVTERCNARCPHCFVDFKSSENELNLEQIEKIALTSGKALRNVALTGGEPFIREDLFEIADIWYKNSTAQSISLCTNGSMPDKIEKFVYLADKKNLPVSFFFSYDFIGEKHSEYRRLNNLHENVLKSYEIIHKYYPKFNSTFNITVNENNYSTAFETYQYMRDVLKIQNINCTLVRGENAYKLSDEQKLKVAETYKLIQENLSKDFDKGLVKGFVDKSITSTVVNSKNKMLWKYVLKTFEGNKYISPCCAGALFAVILSNGDVYPCELLNSKICNLKDYNYDFEECFKSQKAKEIKKYVKTSKCYCTFECIWLLNIFSSPRYFPEILYHIVKNLKRDKLSK